MQDYRCGIGFDVHQFATGRKLILGGIEIPHDLGLAGHSDADVLIHAIIDALLGAAGLGDIGHHFPDTDPAYKGISSLALLDVTQQKVRKAGWHIGNIDATIVAQRPQLAGYIDRMRDSLDAVIRIGRDRISVKATTTERLGFAGREEGMAALATATLYRQVV